MSIHPFFLLPGCSGSRLSCLLSFCLLTYMKLWHNAKEDKQRKWMNWAIACTNWLWSIQLVCTWVVCSHNYIPSKKQCQIWACESERVRESQREIACILTKPCLSAYIISLLCELVLGMFRMRLWFDNDKKRPLNKVMYRNRVEICSMFELLFIFSSLTAAVHRLGGGILPHAHLSLFGVFLVLFLCPSSVLLPCEHCRWILQTNNIIQDCLTCLTKRDR